MSPGAELAAETPEEPAGAARVSRIVASPKTAEEARILIVDDDDDARTAAANFWATSAAALATTSIRSCSR